MASKIRGILGLGAACGAVTFVVGIIVAGASFPGYSHVDQMISELGGADATRPWIQNTNFVVFGLSVIGLAVALAQETPKAAPAALLLGCLGLFGTLLEGVAHCDSGCLGTTTEGVVHLASGLLGFVSGVVGLFLFARLWKADRLWGDHVNVTRWCARAALAGLLLFIASGMVGATTVDGLAQRIFAAPLIVWCFLTGSRLARLARLGVSQ